MNKTLHIAAVVVVAALLLFAGCGRSTKEPEIGRTESVPAVAAEDYLDEGVVLAAFLWEEGFSGALFLPAKILTQASEKNEGHYEVQAVVGSPDVSPGQKHMTVNVILKSHPAQKEELEEGQVVLYTGDETARTGEELRAARWHRGLMLSAPEPGNDLVEIGYYYNLEEKPEKIYKIHIKNLRISDDPGTAEPDAPVSHERE